MTASASVINFDDELIATKNNNKYSSSGNNSNNNNNKSYKPTKTIDKQHQIDVVEKKSEHKHENQRQRQRPHQSQCQCHYQRRHQHQKPKAKLNRRLKSKQLQENQKKKKNQNVDEKQIRHNDVATQSSSTVYKSISSRILESLRFAAAITFALRCVCFMGQQKQNSFKQQQMQQQQQQYRCSTTKTKRTSDTAEKKLSAGYSSIRNRIHCLTLTKSTCQPDFVLFAAAATIAVTIAATTTTINAHEMPFPLKSPENATTFFGYYENEKDANPINRTLSMTTSTPTVNNSASTDLSMISMAPTFNPIALITSIATAGNTSNVTTTSLVKSSTNDNDNDDEEEEEEWSHFYDLILSWQGICLIAVFCTFIVITIIGNTLVILAVITTRRLKTVTNCFVMSLAVADLLVGIFVMPPAVAVHLIGSWQLGWVLCDIWISLDVLLCTASILSLCAISVDRYLAVTQPLNYSRKRRSKRLALIMILIVWTLALAITCPPMLGWYEPGRRDLKECRYNQNEGYVIFSAMGSFFIPMAVMIYVYARISCVIASRHDNMTDISVHNKKFKRYTAADVDNDMEHDLSELELSSTQKKQAAARTFSNQTIVKELHEVMLSDNGENGGGGNGSGGAVNSARSTQCHSLLALTTSNTRNGCYELTRPTSFRRSTPQTPTQTLTPTATSMTSGCGVSGVGSNDGNGDVDIIDGCGINEKRQHWTFSGNIATGNPQMRTQSMRQHQHHQHESLNTTNVGGCGVVLKTSPPHQHQHQHQHHQDSITVTQARQTRIYQHPHQHQHPHPHHHHHTKSLSNRVTSMKKENKTTQTLSIVVGGFIACWLPFFVYYLITPFLEEHQVSRTLAKVLTWLGWFNSAINPFIYAFYSVDFRAAFWRLTCKRFFSGTTKPQFPSNTMSIRR